MFVNYLDTLIIYNVSTTRIAQFINININIKSIWCNNYIYTIFYLLPNRYYYNNICYLLENRDLL